MFAFKREYTERMAAGEKPGERPTLASQINAESCILNLCVSASLREFILQEKINLTRSKPAGYLLATIHTARERAVRLDAIWTSLRESGTIMETRNSKLETELCGQI